MFTSDEKYVFIGGAFTGGCKLYSFNNGTMTYIQDIKADKSGAPLTKIGNHLVWAVSITSDDKYVIVGGGFSGKCKIYSYHDGVVTYLRDMKDDNNGTKISDDSGTVLSTTITSDDKYIFIGGQFPGKCKVYSPLPVLCKSVSESNKYIAYDAKVYKYSNRNISEGLPLPISSIGNVSLPDSKIELIPIFIKDNYVIFFDHIHGKMHYFKMVNDTLVGIETITISSSDHYSNISVSNDNRFILISSPYYNERVKLYKYNNGKITFVKELSPTTAYSITEFLPVNCGDIYRSWVKTAGTRKK